MNNLSWSIALLSSILVFPAVAYWVLPPKRKKPPVLPSDWALSPRPVFNTNERRAYRLLHDALPQYIILSKLPLVRFCQPVEAAETRYWYDLLGTVHVGFAICSANGRVLAAIDLEMDRGTSKRVTRIKQSVLAACRVSYLRCPPDQLPSLDELQALVPHSNAAPVIRPTGVPIPPGLSEARESLVSTVASRRAQRTNLWHEQSAFQDSFFAPDSRFDSLGGLDFAVSSPPEEVPAHPTDHRSTRQPEAGRHRHH